MPKKYFQPRDCRFCKLHQQAISYPSTDHLYVFFKNILSFLGYVEFEAELYRLIEQLKK